MSKGNSWMLGQHFYCDDCDYIPSSRRDAQKHCDTTGHVCAKESVRYTKISPREIEG